MSVVSTDLKMFQATTMPSGLTTEDVGGAITATQVTGSTVGEIFPTLASAGDGDGTRTCYASVFWSNTNADNDLLAAKVYLRNALATVGSAGTVSLASTSASDDDGKFVRVKGYNSSSEPLSEDITLNGTTPAVGAETFSAIHRIECRLVSGGALTTTAGDITCTRGSVLGMIPAGYKSATSEVAFGLEVSLDTSATTTDATTAPGGISFSAPTTYDTGTACANSGTLTADANQQMWVRLQIAERAKASADIDMVFALSGETE